MKQKPILCHSEGEGRYCGYSNPVEPGMWVGGIVGLKAILGIRRRDAALDALQCLAQLGFLSWSLDPSTKRLSYRHPLFFGRMLTKMTDKAEQELESKQQ